MPTVNDSVLANMGTGQSIQSSAPLHAALIHVPFVFLASSFFLNSFQLIPAFPNALVSTGLVSTGVSMKDFAKVSGVMNKVGLLGAVPAVATGLCELYALYRIHTETHPAQQEFTAPKLKAAMTHAGLMDAAIGVGAWNWWASRGQGFLPRRNAIVSTLALPIILYSAHIGGKLAYAYGVGVQRQGLGFEFKQKQEQKSK
ncbi:hypothetical protein JCM16303_002315 [Sporobolomyces ruberrimus]